MSSKFQLQKKGIFYIWKQSKLKLKKNNKYIGNISAHADGGPRFRVCARETLRSAPHRHERKFSGTRFCRVTFKIFEKNLKKPKNRRQGAIGGGRGQKKFYPIFFYPNFYYFFLGAHAKFGNPTTTLSGRSDSKNVMLQ